MRKALVILAAVAFVLPGCARQGGSGSALSLTGPSVVGNDVPTDPCVSSVTSWGTGEEPSCGTGRFTGGGFQIADGVKVTRGFTIHCDLLLSNNLEINWGGGSNFHMTEHVTTVSCTDSPEIEQQPPDSPVDTIVGIGTGRYNGVDGYTINFRLEDHGEPGKNDRASFLITGPEGVVLNVPLQNLGGGNIQTHFDQPHK